MSRQVLQNIMQPSIVDINKQLQPQCRQQTCHCPNQPHQAFTLQPISYYSFAFPLMVGACVGFNVFARLTGRASNLGRPTLSFCLNWPFCCGWTFYPLNDIIFYFFYQKQQSIHLLVSHADVNMFIRDLSSRYTIYNVKHSNITNQMKRHCTAVTAPRKVGLLGVGKHIWLNFQE